jgi:hypothetical protein
MHVNIAGQHDRIRRFRFLQPVVEALPGGDVAVPFVHRESAVGIDLRHVAHVGGNLLSDHRPLAGRRSQVGEQPILLFGAQHRAIGLKRFGAVAVAAVAAGLIRSPLSRVEHVQVDEIAELQPPVNLHVAA